MFTQPPTPDHMTTPPSFWRRPRHWIVLAVLLPVLSIATLCLSRAWSSPELHGRVAAPDGRPVAGAHVVVTWDAVAYWTNSGIGTLHLAEAVTDVNGHFSIPGWRGKYIKGGTMQGSEPTTRVFKDGFVPLVLPNPQENVLALARQDVVYRLQGKTLTLVPFSGTPAQYAQLVQPFRSELYHRRALDAGDQCLCRHMPRMVHALETLRTALAAAGVAASLGDAPGCCQNP